MLSQQLVVALRPEDEVSVASATIALEAQAEGIAPPSDGATAESAEALLPVKEVAIASIPRDREFPETPSTPSFRNDDSADSARKTSKEAMPTDDATGGIAPQMPSSTQDLLQSIRIGWRGLAGETGMRIRRLSQATVRQALEIGQRLSSMQKDLKRKEYSQFLSVLGWASAKARKFINLALVFDGFEPSQLIGVELTTLLSLCSKRYQAVVEQLREVQDITQQLVEQLIKDTRKPRAPKQEPISGWKRSRSGGGRYYNVLLHSEEVGLSIERQAESEAILPQKVIAEAVALREHSKSGSVQPNEYYRDQLKELHDVVNNARELERELRQRDRRIAELEAKLASGAVVPSTESDGAQTDEGTVVPSKLEASLESLPLGSAPDAIAEIEPLMALASECKEPIQKSEHLESALEGDARDLSPYGHRLVEKEHNAQNLELDNSPLKEGDLVEINATSDRTWNGLTGYIQKLVTATGIAVVLLQGDYSSKHFFLGELKLVENFEENPEGAIVTDHVGEYSPSLGLEAEAEPDTADGSDAESEAHTVAKTSSVFPSDAAPDSKLLPLPEQKPQSNRNLQPVEILTTAGEWVGGYFVHTCIAVGNLVNSDRQFTLFDANGQMYRFFGRIRPEQGCVVR